MKNIKTTTNLTCPKCDHLHKNVEMPTNACQHFFKCKNCNEIMKPKEKDCCVFCSYADGECPPKQQDLAT